MPEVIQPQGWARPSGYAHGMLAQGRVLAIAGQIGAPDGGPVVAGGLVPQFDRALANVGAVLEAAGGGFGDLVSMTVYVTDQAAYRQARAPLGEVWRRRAGRTYPAMTLVQVSGLLAEGAEVEVQALAVLS
jgi:enamine deaminase RidA (YjgF/YER057c/UK114 family)